MLSFIISSYDFDLALKKAYDICGEEKIEKSDREVLSFEKPLGIEDVRNLQKKIILKPIKGFKKSVVLNLTNGATPEAQNSMLKMLEEPPPNTMIILITQNFNSLLPTILSRCKLIEIKGMLSTDDVELKSLLALVGDNEKLYAAQSLSKDKAQATIWAEKMIILAREEMIKNTKDDTPKSFEFRKLIKKLGRAHFDLKNTNTNPRLVLENLFLGI